MWEHSRFCEQLYNTAIACVCVCDLNIMFCDGKSKNDGKYCTHQGFQDAKTKDLTSCNTFIYIYIHLYNYIYIHLYTFDILYYVVRPCVIFLICHTVNQSTCHPDLNLPTFRRIPNSACKQWQIAWRRKKTTGKINIEYLINHISCKNPINTCVLSFFFILQ